jgi:NADH:ubiquinone oxidoreductase subunit 6 (subunit J)
MSEPSVTVVVKGFPRLPDCCTAFAPLRTIWYTPASLVPPVAKSLRELRIVPITEAVFYVLATFTLVCALGVALTNNVMYSAFSLMGTLLGVAGTFIALGADFLGVVQLLVYVGGILVLLLFGVMLTHKIYDLDLRSETGQLLPGAIVAAGLFVILAATAVRTQWSATPRPPAPTTDAIGQLFMGQYLLPFEAASILLLVALVGAAMIVRRRRDA